MDLRWALARLNSSDLKILQTKKCVNLKILKIYPDIYAAPHNFGGFTASDCPTYGYGSIFYCEGIVASKNLLSIFRYNFSKCTKIDEIDENLMYFFRFLPNFTKCFERKLKFFRISRLTHLEFLSRDWRIQSSQVWAHYKSNT